MKKLIFLFLSFFTLHSSLFISSARADEGMWLLPYLDRIAHDMKERGLKIDTRHIYNENGRSLKDAIVIFGGGAEVVSTDGLLLTNHHCGYGNIQSLSSPENDYLQNGFWAMSRAEEIPAPGLKVTFIRHIVDVTEDVLEGVRGMAVGSERDGVVARGVNNVKERFQDRYPDFRVVVQPFMGGNQYFMVAMEVFSDVRLVGTPPNSMGKFGGDTDNWMWPRHTDDFSMFRIYAGRDNKPAEYSVENVPYKAPVHLKISLKGVDEGDFSMILGFPGSTDRYMTSAQMRHLMDVSNANRIFVRGERLSLILEDMEADPVVRLKYAAKYASSANYWKNSIGMNKALVDNGVLARKAALEARYQAWAEGQSDVEYGMALEKIREAVEAMSEVDGARQVLGEALWMGSEILGVAQRVGSLVRSEEGKVVNKAEVMESVAGFYKDYSVDTDRRVSRRMFALVREVLPERYWPSVFHDMPEGFVDDMFDRSVFTSAERLSAFLDDYDEERLYSDPAYVARGSVRDRIVALQLQVAPFARQADDWHGVYIRGLSEMDPGLVGYPDANFSIRLTYGNVMPYDPRDGVTYHYYTTLKGVLEKEDLSNPLEFTVDPKLKVAYAASDYGVYGQDGELRLNFLSNNDITGGNSGSPVLNGRGELIGLAFDGNWEAMSGDVMFEPELQRCINVDIRYVLWTIDRFAGAGYLLDEMTIVR